MRDPESAARSSLRRSLVVYGVILALDVLLLWYMLSAGVMGIGYATLVAVGLVGVLLAYQAWTHIRDLSAPLAESEGIVARKWTRADLIIVWHSYYLTVGRTVFRVRPEDYVLVDEDMYVKVVHLPHTLNVISVHELQGNARPADAE